MPQKPQYPPHNTSTWGQHLLVAISILILLAQGGIKKTQAQAPQSTFNHLSPAPADTAGAGYSFWASGHLLGINTATENPLPSSTFLDAIPKINSTGSAFFIGLGDVLRYPGDSSVRNAFKRVSRQLKIPFYNTPGNHDLAPRAEYEQDFGPGHFFFEYGGDGFLFVDSELEPGRESDRQEAFLDSLLDASPDGSGGPILAVRTLFVFSHRLLWVDCDTAYKSISPFTNNVSDIGERKTGICQLYSKIKDWGREHPVYLFGGDIGIENSFPLFYDHPKNSKFHVIGNGIGELDRDVMLRIEVNSLGEVTIVPVSLGSQEYGPIEDYGIDYWNAKFGENGSGSSVSEGSHSPFWTKIKSWLAKPIGWVGLGVVLLLFLLYAYKR